MDIQTGNPDFAWLCVFGLVVVALAVWSHLAYQRAAARFAMAPMRKRLVPGRSTAAGLLSAALVTISVVLLGVALMDLRWGKTSREVPQKGIEVMFALDVSRSMLAEDTTPNRLERAKQQINDMVDEMAGDRVGLVVFAGSAKRAVPLTSHYQDFKKILDSVGPHTVARGGSRLGVAIQKAADGFITKTNDHKTIILFTDGEDQESHPLELARKLHAEEGMRIFTVGLGDTDQGARIPDARRGGDQFLKHEGQQVWSKLNGQVLRALATETDGAYIPAGTKQVNMADVYHRYVASVQQTEFETAKIKTTIPRFQWFAGAALLLLLLESSLANGPWRTGLVGLVQRRRAPKAKKANAAATAGSSTAPLGGYRQGAAGTAAILFCLMFTAGAAAEETVLVAEQINAANQDLRDKNVAQALESLQGIDDPAGQYQEALNYNLAVAHYRNEDIPAAEALFLSSAQSADTSIAAAGRYNLGNCHYSQALAISKQDPQAAIDQLQAAITHYRSSLRLNADNADARANIELARQLIDQLQKEQEQQQQQENQDQENQDQENQDQENQDQENQDQQSQDGENQDQQNQNQENQDQQNQDQQSQDGENQDQENKDQENQDQENQDQQGQDGENQDQQSQDGENQDQQSQDGENQDQKNQDGENQDQQQQQNQDQQNQDGQSQAEQSQSQKQQQQDQQPQNQQQSQQQGQEQQAQDPESAAAEDQQADSPETPSGELTSVNDEPNETSPDEDQQAAVTGQMTREEALKMLQSVRDRDMLRRLQQQQRQRSRRVRVDKDW